MVVLISVVQDPQLGNLPDESQIRATYINIFVLKVEAFVDR